jgi:NAD-dependent dihydropyrimidine dehydrogenase PreA subunit
MPIVQITPAGSLFLSIGTASRRWSLYPGHRRATSQCATGIDDSTGTALDIARDDGIAILTNACEFVIDERRTRCSGPSNRFLPGPILPLGRGADRMAYVIAQPCIGTKDASCVEVCPVDCIHSEDDQEQYFINPSECIDCGVCAEVCPVEAIFFEDDLPEQWAAFKAKNAAYYS